MKKGKESYYIFLNISAEIRLTNVFEGIIMKNTVSYLNRYEHYIKGRKICL